jgi:glycosyltransferase involved in cell wall biosynthesis
MTETSDLTREDLAASQKGGVSALSWYPLDICPDPVTPEQELDSLEKLMRESMVEKHPTVTAQQALVCWNQYLASGHEDHRKVFLAQARSLMEREVRFAEDVGGWPISYPGADNGEFCLSASTQGSCISVLMRAYQISQEREFSEVAERAVQSFTKDILDGGVQAPLGENGVCFEDVAVYPASHVLSGFIVALFGLYDYAAITGDTQIQELFKRGLATMCRLLSEFDTGYWAHADLLSRRLATPAQLSLQGKLLEALARRSNCEQCSATAVRWKGYTRMFTARLRYLASIGWFSLRNALLGRVRAVLFLKSRDTTLKHVCVALPAFPLTGGVLTVLEGVAQVTKGMWELEFLAQHVGPNPNACIIHQFGDPKMAPTQFPSVWHYVFTGWWKLIALMRKGTNYQVILPQDGVFTAAFAAIAAKLAGIRVVCVDHGQLTLLKNARYRAERIQGLASRPPLVQLIGRLRFALYWPSLHILARISARLVDHFLIPGVAGDEVEENCTMLGISASCLTRFASMIDINRHFVLDTHERAQVREKYQIPSNAVVMAIICRLSPEKGLDIALESIYKAMSILSPRQSALVRIVIAGDGPLRKQLEEIVRKRELSQVCVFWGDIPAKKVLLLLSISDIFLYTSTRGACIPMAVLEAMASGCAVIASEQPMANAHLLAEERGIVIEPGNIEQTTGALVRLLIDPGLCHRMGLSARNYISVQHSAANFKRHLMRATYWSGLKDLVLAGKEQGTN